MTIFDRRGFLRFAGGGALTAFTPGTIRRALAIPANNATGTIADVQHIVVLMQENRSFDHYFGSLRGVRGFGDPRAVFQRDGKSILCQPHDGGHLLPFRPRAEALGATFLEDLPHDWNTTQQAFNGGAWDRWIAAKGTTSMAHLAREDIPFYYALADAFTICDAYHCSLLGPTDPNRYYLWSGCTGNVAGSEPVIDNAEAGYAWSTFPERLERAGISWKIYQDVGNGLDAGNYWGWTSDPQVGNYGDNALLYFRQYQNAQPGDALYEKARRGTDVANGGDLLGQFRADAANGTLPQVSWIIAPEAYSEHPNWPADYGAWYVARVLDALTANPEVWSKTVFLLTYDENDGFFDHAPPPFAPSSRAQGLSTVACDDEIFAGDATWRAGPLGLGPRVPMLVMSPWSRGGYVNSQVFDHTSIIRFIERRFALQNSDLIETNISAWRRAVCGDLTSAFDFARPNDTLPALPDTSALRPLFLSRQPGVKPALPDEPSLPAQEPGMRRARALPYRIEARARCEGGSFVLELQNTGDATAVFHVRSRTHDGGPWIYTIEPGKTVTESWPSWRASAGYEFSVHGPNGFLRRFANDVVDDTPVEPQVESEIVIDRGSARVRVRLGNPTSMPLQLVVNDAYSKLSRNFSLAPTEQVESSWETDANLRWYDLRVSDFAASRFRRQFAGYAENGMDGYSDPAIGHAVALDDAF